MNIQKTLLVLGVTSLCISTLGCSNVEPSESDVAMNDSPPIVGDWSGKGMVYLTQDLTIPLDRSDSYIRVFDNGTYRLDVQDVDASGSWKEVPVEEDANGAVTGYELYDEEGNYFAYVAVDVGNVSGVDDHYSLCLFMTGTEYTVVYER